MNGERPLRLLMTADAVGGVWQYASELALGLTAHGIETVLALLGPLPNGGVPPLAGGGGRVRVVDTGLPLDWLSEPAAVRQASLALAELATAENADVVHLNSPALAAELRLGVPLLGVTHGCLSTWWEAARAGQPLDPGFVWHREMMARGLRACERIIAPSASYAAVVQRHYRLPTPPRVVHNGRSPVPSRQAGPLHDCALTVGRLWDEVKNARTLDAAAARLPFPFHAAGSVQAPHGGAVALDHLHLLGQLDEAALRRWFAAQPVFVSAATFEPFGLSVLEAASAGCALVLSDIATFRELWDGAATFVTPGDERGFADAIIHSAEDLEYRRRMGEAARERAQRYSAERMAAAMAAHYFALVAERAAA